MKFSKALILIPLVVTLASCETVLTTEPIGDTVVKLSPEQWQGKWLHPEVVVFTTVLDEEKGELQASWIEREGEGTRTEVAKGTVRASGDKMYFVTRHEKRTDLFLWARVKRGENYLIMWPPNVQPFKNRIESGKWPGEVTEDHVVLGELTPEVIEMIDDPSANLLDWKNPFVFIRIGD